MMMAEARCWIECRSHVRVTRRPSADACGGWGYDRRVSLPSDLPEQPQLRAAAVALEQTRMVGSVLDHKWRTIFLSTDVANGQLLAGVMHATGQLSDGVEPFTTRFRIEFHDEPDERTRLEIRQWLPEDLAGPSEQGWLQAFTKLDAILTTDPATAAIHRNGATWAS